MQFGAKKQLEICPRWRIEVRPTVFGLGLWLGFGSWG